jgi:hypothetical protein
MPDAPFHQTFDTPMTISAAKVTFVTVGTYWTPWPAWMLRNKLADAGVNAFVHDEFAATMNWYYANAIRGIKVQVPLEQVARAEEVIARDDSEILPPEPHRKAESEEPKCCRCTSADIHEEVVNVRYFLLVWVISGFALPLFSTAVECYQCGHREGPPATFTHQFGLGGGCVSRSVTRPNCQHG